MLPLLSSCADKPLLLLLTLLVVPLPYAVAFTLVNHFFKILFINTCTLGQGYDTLLTQALAT